MSEPIALSILILSIPERNQRFLQPLLENLERQTKDQPVEVLVLTDNMKRSIGEKRNLLKSMAKGEYLCYVDDDDRISDDYVSWILRAIKDKSDTIVFRAWVTLNGDEGKMCYYGKDLKHENRPNGYYRKPNHLMVHRRELVQNIDFKEVSFGEDDEWAARVAPHLKTESQINKVLYYYQFSKTTSRSRK